MPWCTILLKLVKLGRTLKEAQQNYKTKKKFPEMIQIC